MHMRTTLDLPEKLLEEAKRITKEKTKTGVIILALKNIIQQNKIAEIKKFKGKIPLNINLDQLRERT